MNIFHFLLLFMLFMAAICLAYLVIYHICPITWVNDDKAKYHYGKFRPDSRICLKCKQRQWGHTDDWVPHGKIYDVKCSCHKDCS